MRTYNKVKGYRTYLLKIMVCTIMTWSTKLLSIEAQGTDSQSSPQAPGEVKSRANKDAVHKIKGRKPLNKKKLFFCANRRLHQKRRTENMGQGHSIAGVTNTGKI